MYRKKFSPKSKLLQYDLDAFLYWRFQTQRKGIFTQTLENLLGLRDFDLLVTEKENVYPKKFAAQRYLFGRRPTLDLPGRSSVNTGSSGLLFDSPYKSPQKAQDILFSNQAQTQKIEASGFTKPLLKQKKFYTASNLHSRRSRSAGRDGSAPIFFPEKKNFMQFWTLPLLGASVLSFLNFESYASFGRSIHSVSTFSPGEAFGIPTQIASSLTRPSRFSPEGRPNASRGENQPFISQYRDAREDPQIGRKQNLTNQTYLSDYPLISCSTKKIWHSNTYKNEVENLCLFYLNLTEEKLNRNIDWKTDSSYFSSNEILPYRLNLPTESEGQVEPTPLKPYTQRLMGEFEKNLLLKFLYYQNSFFHWNSYTLYSPDNGWVLKCPNTSNQNVMFFQKLNSGFQLFDSKKESLIKQTIRAWKKNPSLSYFKSAQFFESWLLNLLSFQNLTQNQLKFSDDEIPYFLQVCDLKETFFNNVTERSKVLQLFEKLLRALNQSKRVSIQAYGDLNMLNSQSKVRAKLEGIGSPMPGRENNQKMEKTIQTNLMEIFEKKYKSSNSQIVLQKKLFEILKNQYKPKRSLTITSETRKFKELLKKSVSYSVFNKSFSPKNTDLSIAIKGKSSTRELFLLKHLRTPKPNTLIQQDRPLIRKFEDLNVEFVGLDKESKKFEILKKNPEKWMQEIKLYSQLEQVHKKVIERLNKKKADAFLFSKKTHVYFSDNQKEKPITNFMNLPTEYLEISPTSTISNHKGYILNSSLLNVKGNEEFKEKTFLINSFSKLKPTQKHLFSKQWNQVRSFLANTKNFKSLANFNPNIYIFEKKDNQNPFPKLFFKKKLKNRSSNVFSKNRITRSTKAWFYKHNSRKVEKTFRSYLSIKNSKGLQNKKVGEFFMKGQNQKSYTDYQKLYLTLKHLKETAIRKTLIRNHNSKAATSLQYKKLFVGYQTLGADHKSEMIMGDPEATNAVINKRRDLLAIEIARRFFENENKVQFQKLQDFLFLKEANFLKNGDDSKLTSESRLFEKKKSLEKKRRFKKLKLENRRRKKRKRFYPRPHSLRFQLYMQFLQKRHKLPPSVEKGGITSLREVEKGDTKSSDISKDNPLSQLKNNEDSKNFSRNYYDFTISEILKPASGKLNSLRYTDFLQHIYGQKFNLAPFSSKSLALRDSLSMTKTLKSKESLASDPIFSFGLLKTNGLEMPHDKEFYRISNQTLTEFERLCWKSYWLRSNLKPYVLKIQKSLKRMKELENFKTNLQFPSLRLTLPSQFLEVSPAYTNSRSAQSKSLANTQLKSQTTQSFKANSEIYLFQNLANKAEYQRLISERMNDEIKNVKSQLTLDGQSQARSYKTGRQKLENKEGKPFWNAPFALSNNYFEPNLNTATSFINSPFIKTDFAKKDFPTLRLLWACQKSQLFTYQPNNLAQNLWTSYKIREQTKNNKTRKFFYRLSRKMNDLKDWMKVYKFQKFDNDPEKLEKQNEPNHRRVVAISQLSLIATTKSNQKKEQTLTLDLLNEYKNKKLQNLSVFKTNWTNKKMQTFGGLIFGKNYDVYLKQVRFQLQKNPNSKKIGLLKEKTLKGFSNLESNIDLNCAIGANREAGLAKSEIQGIPTENQSEFQNQKKKRNQTEKRLKSGPSLASLETSLQNPIQKRQFHFWWSLQKSSSPFMLDFLFSNSENSFLYTNLLNSNSSFFNSKYQKELLLQFLWLSACMLHVGIFFALIRIPEMRSLLKFQVLLFSKLCNAYFLGIFTLYDLLKNYGLKIQHLSKNILKVSTSRLGGLKNQNIHSLNSHFYENRLQFFQDYKSSSIFRKSFVSAHGLTRVSSFSLQPTVSLRGAKRRKSEAVLAKSKGPRPNEMPALKKWQSNQNWIQSTMHWKFYYKNFSNFNQTSENAISIYTTRTSELLHLTTISPIYGKTNSQDFLLELRNMFKTRGEHSSGRLVRPDETFQNNESKNGEKNSAKAYQSWSTGFFWKTVLKNLDIPKFLSHKKRLNKLFNTSKDNAVYSEARPLDFSYSLQTNIQMQAFLTLGALAGTRLCFSAFYICLNFFYKIVFHVIDLLEGALLIFYKFLEKPAEVLVDWIAEVFLIEWTSEIHTYVPEAFDTAAWTSLTKYSRSLRSQSAAFGLTGTGFFYGALSAPFGFLLQRFFLESTQIFYQWLLKPDSDLLSRQKKGIIFWDIWSEILIQAAEKYKMNLSSLSTVKEEQELLIENLLEQKSMETSIAPLNNQTSMSKVLKKKDFLKNEVSNSLPSVAKLNPLMKFIQTFEPPHFYSVQENPGFAPMKHYGLPSLASCGYNRVVAISELSLIASCRYERQPKATKSNQKEGLVSRLSTSDRKVYGSGSDQTIKSFSENLEQNSLKRWSVTQYLNTQGKDTDLFMDIHPPKSFEHVSFLKGYLPAQEILGSLVCEIYAGLFSSKVSKNVLIVGAQGMAKTFFIQALAGETELKIVLDNAHRYAFVNGGVPVGMKLLREVFASIALHTPCLFLLEDVHVIGERRPMLISDDETSNASTNKDFSLGAEQEEVHEKNKLVYQLSKHALSHYKKPYKGDFSMAIPTNHFCYDLFLGVSPPRKRRSDLTPSSPLPIQQLDASLNSPLGLSSGGFNNGKVGEADRDGSTGEKNLASDPLSSHWLSSMQIAASSGQVFAPPATSPFNVLLMKEQKKLKPKKFVKDVPWSGLSYDQWMLLSKSNYSVRVKIALLAEVSMKNFSAKLDMITDLLVIIDSVRSNRGFVVFATTHLPALLDPALRRPGRLDETISLPLLPNRETRFEILKTRLSSYTESMDFFDWSLYSGQTKQNENQLANFLNKNILLLFNSKYTTTNNGLFAQSNRHLSNFINSDFFPDYPIYSLSQAFQSSLSLQSLWNNADQFKKMLQNASKHPLKLGEKSDASAKLFKQSENDSQMASFAGFLKMERSDRGLVWTSKMKNNYVALSYAQTGQFLTEALLLKDQNTYAMKFVGNLSFKEFSEMDNHKFLFQSLYSSNLEAKQTLFKLFASKISEFFVFQTFSPALSSGDFNNQSLHFEKSKHQVTFSEFTSSASQKVFFNSRGIPFSRSENSKAFDKNPSNIKESSLPVFNNIQNSLKYWQAATSFLDAMFQKRYLYNKNTILFKMLFFEDKVSLAEPPSPPNSSILSPSRKFENYQKTLRDFMQKPGLTINEKLQMHQKQRFLKLLYNIPVSKPIVSTSKFEGSNTLDNSSANIIQPSVTTRTKRSPDRENFYDSFKELSYLDLVTLRPSSTYAFYKNRFFQRQRFSFLNQWWNGQLSEHNAENTYLSHIDWRSMFVPSLGDVFLDFPDAEQYYNPRNRRWFLQSKTWSYWLNFETDLRQQISEHFLVECFTQTTELLNSNREMVDYLAYRFLRNHQLHELDLVQVLVRFHKQEKVSI